MISSGFMHLTYRVSVWVTRLFSINLMWLLVNLPIVFLVFNIFLATKFNDLFINTITVFILSPFMLFPSTTAMFGVVRMWIIGEEQFSVYRSFFKLYKENYKRSLTGGIIIVPVWFILVIDYVYFSNSNSPLYYLFLVFIMFMFVITLYFFSNTVHFHLKLWHSLKNSFLLSVGNPGVSISLTIINGLLIFISITTFNLLFFLGLGSIIAYTSFFAFYKGQPKYKDTENGIRN